MKHKNNSNNNGNGDNAILKQRNSLNNFELSLIP